MTSHHASLVKITVIVHDLWRLRESSKPVTSIW